MQRLNVLQNTLKCDKKKNFGENSRKCTFPYCTEIDLTRPKPQLYRLCLRFEFGLGWLLAILQKFEISNTCSFGQIDTVKRDYLYIWYSYFDFQVILIILLKFLRRQK